MPAQGKRIMDEHLAEPSFHSQHRLAQKRKRRLGRIQIPEPSAQGGGIGHPLRILDSGRRSFPATTFHKVTSKRLATGDQAVVAIGQREKRQKGERLPAQIAEAAPNRNPVMIFVISLFCSVGYGQQSNRTDTQGSGEGLSLH